MVFVVLAMGSYGPSFTGDITAATIDGGSGPVPLTLVFLETAVAARKLWVYYYPTAAPGTTYGVAVTFTGNPVVPGALISVNFASNIGTAPHTHTVIGAGERSVTATLPHAALLLGVARDQIGTTFTPLSGQSVLVNGFGVPGASGHSLLYVDQLTVLTPLGPTTTTVTSTFPYPGGVITGSGEMLYGVVPIYQ